MKTQTLISLVTAALCSCAAAAQEESQPLVQVRIQSFDALTTNAKRVATALGLSADWSPRDHLAAALGSPDLAGVDRDRSWQLALAMRNPGAPPLIALYVPVTNFETFKNGLKDASPLKGGDHPSVMFPVAQFAVIVFHTGQAGELSDGEKQKITAWAPASGAHLLGLVVQLDETARQQALQALAMGKMVVTQSIAQPKKLEGSPFQPEAMAQLMGLYFEGFETVVQGLDRLEVQVDLADSMFTMTKTIRPLPDSELARWFKAGGVGVSDLAQRLDPNATMSLAGAIGEKPAFYPTLKKLVRVSFQMQNQEVDEKLAGQIDRMMDVLAPMRFVGSADFGKALSFAGVYEFPGAGAGNAYAALKQFFTNAMPSITGTNKAYASAEFKEGHRKVAGRAVDRFTVAFNLDAPMFKVPGQREAMERMWPGGKMEVEYAVKGSGLYLAHPDKMAELLEPAPRPQAAAALGANANTALIGRANVLALIKQMTAINPMLPAALREKFEKINPEGGDIRFRVDLDGRLFAKSDVPLKILEAFRQFQNADKKDAAAPTK